MIFDFLKNQKKPAHTVNPEDALLERIRRRHLADAPAQKRDERRLRAMERALDLQDAETPSARTERLLARAEELVNRLNSRADEDLARCKATEEKVIGLLHQALEVDGELAVNADEYMAELDQDDAQEVRDEEAWNRESQSPRRR